MNEILAFAKQHPFDACLPVSTLLSEPLQDVALRMQVSHSSSRSIPQHFMPVDVAESLRMMLDPVQSSFAGGIHGS